MLDWLCCLHHQFDWNFRVLIWDYSFIFHLNSCVLVILAKDLNFDKTRNTHALVYGRKPDLLGINVVDYVYYYYAYCYYKTIIKPHKIQYIFLNLHPGNSYLQLITDSYHWQRDSKTLPSENLPCEDKQFKKVYLHISSCLYLSRWPSWIQIKHYWR